MYLSETRPTEVATKPAQQDSAARAMAALQAFMAADFIDELAANIAKESVYLVDTANENDLFELETVAA